jgi:hypothetical protein
VIPIVASRAFNSRVLLTGSGTKKDTIPNTSTTKPMMNNGRILLLVLPQSRGLLKLNSAACDQVDDQHDNSQYQQQMDEAASNVEAEAQKPQDQQNRKNCPKH